MNLLIDIGNYRIKWITSTQLVDLGDDEKFETAKKQTAFCDADDLTHRLRSSFTQLCTTEKFKSVVVSSVSKENLISLVSELSQDLWRLTPQVLSSTQCARGVSNHYQTPHTLGVDRWAALIGASSINKQSSAILVIDAGTAITMDYLDEKLDFNGGVIFPGMATMISSLNHSTEQIRVEQQSVRGNIINLQNKNTKSAVSNGIYHCVIAAIDRAIDYYEKLDHSRFKTIITGGDAPQIEQLSQHNMQVVPELVFIGIQALAAEQA